MALSMTDLMRGDFMIDLCRFYNRVAYKLGRDLWPWTINYYDEGYVIVGKWALTPRYTSYPFHRRFSVLEWTWSSTEKKEVEELFGGKDGKVVDPV
jgi:hypothetical protein